jgi:pentatricopeptide repeat protein
MARSLCAGAKQGVKPDVSIFNSMIAACAHGGEHAKARAMFDSMAEHGCLPDAVTYANLIRAYKKGGQWCAAPAPACPQLSATHHGSHALLLGRHAQPLKRACLPCQDSQA